MSLLSPRVFLICAAVLPAAACAEGMGGPIYQGMDGSVNGDDDGGGNSGGSTGDPTGGTTGEPQCMATSGTCAAPAAFPAWGAPQPDGSQTTMLMSNTSMFCGQITSAACPSAGLEAVHQLMMPINGKLSIGFQTAPDPNLNAWPASVYVTTACGDVVNPLLACQSAIVGMPFAPIALNGPFTAGQILFIYVDGPDLTQMGDYMLTITASP